MKTYKVLFVLACLALGACHQSSNVSYKDVFADYDANKINATVMTDYTRRCAAVPEAAQGANDYCNALHQAMDCNASAGTCPTPQLHRPKVSY